MDFKFYSLQLLENICDKSSERTLNWGCKLFHLFIGQVPTENAEGLKVYPCQLILQVYDPWNHVKIIEEMI